MGETTTRYSGQKWSVQLTPALADAAERARRLTGYNRQELLSAALEEFIERHQAEWLKDFQAKFTVDTASAKK